MLLGSIITLISFVFIANNFLALPLWAVALGIGFAPIPVYVFSLLPEIVKPHQVGMGLGLLTVASNLGTTLGPTALGSILDQTKGDFFVAIMALAMVSLVIILISFLLKSKAIAKEDSLT
ncbi:MAG: MFS transporter [Thermincola sp.]|nr:MFS transporter [Thermincola sp.]